MVNINRVILFLITLIISTSAYSRLIDASFEVCYSSNMFSCRTDVSFCQGGTYVEPSGFDISDGKCFSSGSTSYLIITKSKSYFCLDSGRVYIDPNNSENRVCEVPDCKEGDSSTATFFSGNYLISDCPAGTADCSAHTSTNALTPVPASLCSSSFCWGFVSGNVSSCKSDYSKGSPVSCNVPITLTGESCEASDQSQPPKIPGDGTGGDGTGGDGTGGDGTGGDGTGGDGTGGDGTGGDGTGGDGTGGDGGDKGDGNSFGGDCIKGFSCTGDPVICAAAKSTWYTQCLLSSLVSENNNSTYLLGKNILGGGKDPSGNPLSKENIKEVDIESMLARAATESFLPSQCILSPSFTIRGRTFTFDTEYLCKFFEVMGFLFVAMTSIVCVRIFISTS